MNEEEFADAVLDVTDAVLVMLTEKNESYGNSALDPVRIFSKADTVEQLKVRIDDKLSRLQRGNDTFPEDTVMDLIGYLVLLLIAQGPEETEAEPRDPGELLDWEREILEDQGVPIHEPEFLLPDSPRVVGILPDFRGGWTVPDVVMEEPPQPGSTIYLINNTGAAPA